MASRFPDRHHSFAIAAATICVSYYVQPTKLEAAQAKAEPRLEYRSLPFTAEAIRWDDRRFLLAALEWRFLGGIQLTSRDRTLYSIAWMGGYNAGKLRDGRAIVIWPGTGGGEAVSEVRVARTAELAGSALGRAGGSTHAPSHPEIPGYRYVMSENLFGIRDYLGLWQRIRGPDDTLVVYFRPASDNRFWPFPDNIAAHRIVGRLPLRLNSLFIHDTAHGVSWDLTIASQARVGRPIYILHYRWWRCLYLPAGQPPCGDEPPG